MVIEYPVIEYLVAGFFGVIIGFAVVRLLEG